MAGSECIEAMCGEECSSGVSTCLECLACTKSWVQPPPSKTSNQTNQQTQALFIVMDKAQNSLLSEKNCCIKHNLSPICLSFQVKKSGSCRNMRGRKWNGRIHTIQDGSCLWRRREVWWGHRTERYHAPHTPVTPATPTHRQLLQPCCP